MSRLDEPLPYYKWLWRDFRANRKVQSMSYVERGLYRELLDECWCEGAIPDDINELAEICRCPVDVMANAWQVLSKCFVLTESGWVNEKLNSLRTASDLARIARAGAGKKGGLSRANAENSKQSEANAKQMLSTCHIAEQSRSRAEAEQKQSRAESDQYVDAAPSRVVFDHWRDVMKSPRAAFDAKRQRIINARLKDGYTVNELCNAITGCSHSPFHMGENDKSTKYNGLELILRNAEKVDQFLAFYEHPPKRPDQKQTESERRRQFFDSATGRETNGNQGRTIDITPTGADPVD